MIVGNGLIAKGLSEFQSEPQYIIFASGVSNSNEVKLENFNREKNLFLDSIKGHEGKHLIYFSSCDVKYKDVYDRPYFKHKYEMEELVDSKCNKYTIFRLPQVICSTDNETFLINFIVNAILKDVQIDVWCNAYKNLISIKDVFDMVKFFISRAEYVGKIINIVNTNYYSMEQLVFEIESLLEKKCDVKLIDKGFKPEYDGVLSSVAAKALDIKFGRGYLKASLADCIDVAKSNAV